MSVDFKELEYYQNLLGWNDADKAKFQANWQYSDDKIDEMWLSKLKMHLFPQKTASVYVMPSYQSPVTGQWIDSPSARRNDLASTNSRPWEGMEQEKKEAKRREAYQEIETDKKVHEMVVDSWHKLPEATQKSLT